MQRVEFFLRQIWYNGFNKEEFLMIKILLVEDDLGLSNSVFDFLDDFADVMQVFDGEEGLYEAESGVYDLILLDLMLPEKNGFQVLKELREKGITTPVLIMTAKESLDDKGHGFELGADDYLTKPFYLEELKMRIQALLKRSGKFNENTLTYGNIVVNLSTNTVKVEDTPVELLGKEFDLLVYFLQNQNVILPKTQIFDRLWGFDSDTTISVVEVYVSKVRKKLKGTTFAENLQTLRSNFGVFTLIFSTMTLIILQVMHSSLYTSVDDKLHGLSENPQAVIQLAVNRATEEIKDLENAATDTSKTEIKPNVSSNTEVILFDKNFTQLLSGNRFLGLDKIKLEKKELGHIYQIQVFNSYGQEEIYRMILMETNISSVSTNIKYAAILINTSQLEQASQKHEKLIVIVMASFWILSLLASLYLARVSVRPLLESMQKQQSFVENASHELRTPLAVLQNRLETLFRKPEATIMDVSESIASSLEEVRNMRFLTTNLLNLARRDDGIKPELAEVPTSFFNTTFTNYEMIASENDRVFRFENRIHRTIVTDQLLLKQLMTILFDNAIKYTEEDGEIDFLISATDRNLYLLVSDNGVGISTEDKKKIFDRFYRVDKARTRQKGGFGLGLSLAKQIVDALKGTITVKDNKPKGTIFEVKIAIHTPSKKKK